MKFKNNIITLIFTLCISFLAIQGLSSQTEGKCLVDICVEEIEKADSEELFSHFEAKGEEAFDAWKILYQADPNINRIKISLLEEVEEYLGSTGRRIEDVVEEIKKIGLGYEGWKLQKISRSKSTPPLSINELLASVDYPASKKKDLKKDLNSSTELVKALGDQKMLEAWSLFYDINVSNELRTEVNSLWAMVSYIEKVKKQDYSFTSKSFNRFIKDKIDKSAYVRSILYPTKGYGGIKITADLLDGVPIVTAKMSSPQYSGAGKFGAYEIRIKNGKVQYLDVDDNGKNNWEVFNRGLQDDINFVFTNDGKLKIGHGHYNLSGEARTVISAGKLIFKNGKVTEISNFSGHYQPSIDNLNKIAEVFKKLNIVDSDFEIFEKPYSRKTESD